MFLGCISISSATDWLPELPSLPSLPQLPPLPSLPESANDYIDLAVRIGNVVKPILEITFVAFIFCLNPYIFPLAAFIGMARNPFLNAVVDKIVAIWDRHWPLLAVLVTPVIVLSCMAQVHITVTVILAGTAVTAGLYWGCQLSEWVEQRRQQSQVT